MAIAYYSSQKYITYGVVTSGQYNNSVNDVPVSGAVYNISETYNDFDGPTVENSQATFLGYTASGDPVFSRGGSTFLFSNNPPLNGSPAPAYTPSSTFVACFLAGTLIAVPQGDRAVEDLELGDLLMTADGRTTTVKWIGRQAVATLFGASDERAPICISAGALGDNSPARDLKLTADHALLIDGVLVQAGALVNGVTIRRMSPAETGAVYTVFHIETEGHQIILAEGCPAETFVDNVSRRRFDNYAEYETLFGDEAETILEMDLPRAMSARQLPASIRDLVAVQRAA